MLLDIVIVLLLLWGAYRGWISGFIKQLASLGGFLVGLLLASLCYSWLGHYLAPHVGESISTTNLIAFILLWVMVPIFLGFVADRLTDALRSLKLGLPNSLLGSAVGIIKFVILLSCIFNVMAGLNLVNAQKSEKSHLYRPVKSSLGVFFHSLDSLAERQSAADKDTTIWVHIKHDSVKAIKADSVGHTRHKRAGKN